MHRDRSCHSHCQERSWWKLGAIEMEVGRVVLASSKLGCWIEAELFWGLILACKLQMIQRNIASLLQQKCTKARQATILCFWCLGMYILSCFGPRCRAETFIGPVGQHPSDKEIQQKISQEKCVGKDRYQSIGTNIISCYDKYVISHKS